LLPADWRSLLQGINTFSRFYFILFFSINIFISDPSSPALPLLSPLRRLFLLVTDAVQGTLLSTPLLLKFYVFPTSLGTGNPKYVSFVSKKKKKKPSYREVGR
jgi:hypothetical protein